MSEAQEPIDMAEIQRQILDGYKSHTPSIAGRLDGLLGTAEALELIAKGIIAEDGNAPAGKALHVTACAMQDEIKAVCAALYDGAKYHGMLSVPCPILYRDNGDE